MTFLPLADGTTATVTKTYGEQLEQPVIVYNFEVSDFHTYYVTDTGVLVHNDQYCLKDRQRIAQECNERATEINNQRPGQQGKRGTTSVMKAIDNETGKEVYLVSTEMANKTKTPKSIKGLLKEDEIYIPGIGHAEETILNNTKDKYTIIAGGTSRNVCKDICAPKIESRGMVIGGPVFRGNSDKTKYRQFWQSD